MARCITVQNSEGANENDIILTGVESGEGVADERDLNSEDAKCEIVISR